MNINNYNIFVFVLKICFERNGDLLSARQYKNWYIILKGVNEAFFSVLIFHFFYLFQLPLQTAKYFSKVSSKSSSFMLLTSKNIIFWQFLPKVYLLLHHWGHYAVQFLRKRFRKNSWYNFKEIIRSSRFMYTCSEILDFEFTSLFWSFDFMTHNTPTV